MYEITIPLWKNRLTILWRCNQAIEEEWAPLHYIQSKAMTLPGYKGCVQSRRDNADGHERRD